MKHIILKFNHGSEIGAQLAYIGHYEATCDKNILHISTEELEHRYIIKAILYNYGHKPSVLIDMSFFIIGTCIRYICRISPRFLLNFVARSLEVFAVFSYHRLAKMYPEYERVFKMMAEVEEKHEKYFRIGI